MLHAVAAAVAGRDVNKDPVCGRELDDGDVAALSSYEGVTYYFCSIRCSREFDLKTGNYYGYAPPEVDDGR